MVLPRAAAALARKELRHIVRDPYSLGLSLAMPLLMVFLFGFAISFDMRDIRISILDQDKSRASRLLIESLGAGGFFRPSQSAGDPVDDVASERARAALVIPAGFQRSIGRGEPPQLSLLLDGSDNASASAAQRDLAGAVASAWGRISGRTGAPVGVALDVQPRYVFNGELNSRWFIVPGLIAVVVGLLSMMLTALAVAKEWENGSMELLLSTPVRPPDIILGKVVPYVALGALNVGMVYGAARLLFGVPFRGSHWVLALACLLFLLVVLAQGLLISVLTRSQVVAFQVSIIVGVLPVMLLSGFIFPIQSMPAPFQILTGILPPRWFIVILRGVFLKGAGLAELWRPFAALAVMCVVFVTAAVKRFKTDMEP
jgi:ABC-2 type transport system permease protein